MVSRKRTYLAFSMSIFALTRGTNSLPEQSLLSSSTSLPKLAVALLSSLVNAAADLGSDWATRKAWIKMCVSARVEARKSQR